VLPEQQLLIDKREKTPLSSTVIRNYLSTEQSSRHQDWAIPHFENAIALFSALLKSVIKG